MLVTEGGVEVEVPEARDGASEGSGDGVFFNPTQELNRDVTVAVLRAYRDRDPRAASYLDAMAATGIRGVRAGVAGYDVTCADVDGDAVALARENLARNGVEGAVEHRDVNALLHEGGPFDVVDVDPFGTPIPFADAALANARDLVCVTATDTAPLCGAHRNSGIRKYSAVPQNTEYHPEMGLRTLLSALVRTAARYDTAAVPILSHVTRHYARTYLELDHRATRADSALEKLGYVHHCDDCLHRSADAGLVAHPPDQCPNCGSRVRTAGPLWLGAVRDADFARAVSDELTDDMGEAARARSLLATLAAEVETPTHYDQHRLCKQWGVPAPAMDDFVAALREAGHDASRAHYHGTALKTTASVDEIRPATAALF
jgi:tRNA (guanine26-N2/guanine27-N2)-dimethyltransferase